MPTAAGIYYTQCNTGPLSFPAVILIHGSGSDHLCWPAELRRLVGYRVLAIDLPGHGHSAGLAQHSVAGYSNKLIELMVALDLYQAVLIGHSLGGAIALQTAYAHPEHVAALGLIASGAYLGVPDDIIENMATPGTLPSALHALENRLFSAKTSPTIMERTRNSLKALRPAVLAGDWLAAANFDLRASAGQITTPTWIATGSADRLTPLPFARFLASTLPNAHLLVVPGAGHLAMLEAPEMVAESLSTFLSGLPLGIGPERKNGKTAPGPHF